MGAFTLATQLQEQILNDILLERQRQDIKWGPPGIAQSLDRRMTILTEEVGEVAEATMNDTNDFTHLREELVQTAAVAVATLEAIDSGKYSW